MKVIHDIMLSNFDAWGGATGTVDKILDANKENEFDDLINEIYPDGIDQTELNDLLWHDEDWILSSLRIEDEEDDDDEEPEEEKE